MRKALLLLLFGELLGGLPACGGSGQWLLQPAPLHGAWCGRGRAILGGWGRASGEALPNSTNRETEQASADGSTFPPRKCRVSTAPCHPLPSSNHGLDTGRSRSGHINSVGGPVLRGTRSLQAASFLGGRGAVPPPGCPAGGHHLGGREVRDIGAWTAPRLPQISLWFLETSKASPHLAPPPAPHTPAAHFHHLFLPRHRPHLAPGAPRALRPLFQGELLPPPAPSLPQP